MKVLRFALLTQIDSAFAYSAGWHIIILTPSMPMYGLHSFLPVVKRSVAVTEHHVAASYWAACWRGIMPQGQRRHNVSLSGCHTGQWRRCESQKAYSSLSFTTSFLLCLTVEGMVWHQWYETVRLKL